MEGARYMAVAETDEDGMEDLWRGVKRKTPRLG